MAHSHLQPRQFKKGAPKKLKKDPVAEEENPTFSGGQGSKTMPVEKPKGLLKKPKKHPHRNHSGQRTRRAR